MVQIALRQIGFHVQRYAPHAALAVMVIVAASLFLTAMHPAAGEIAQNALITAGLLINISLVGFAMLLAIAFAIKVFSEGVKIEREKERAPLLLPAPDGIAPDALIRLEEGETPEQFDARAAVAAERSTVSRWAVVIPFRSPVLTIFGDSARTYNRDEPIFARPEWAEQFDGRIAKEGTSFSTETPEDYAKYIRSFVKVYREWAPRRKAELTAGRPTGLVLEILKHSANILLFILLSVSVFGQSKTRQVDEALGTRIREIPEAGAGISYTFDTGGKVKVYNRTGDGRSSYTELLQKRPGIGSFNDEGGRLVSVTMNGEIVAKAAHVELVNSAPSTAATKSAPNGYVEEGETGDRIRPRGLVPEQQEVNVPDSTEIAAGIEAAKREFDYRKTELWAMIKPIWRGLMYMFFGLLPILICGLGLLNYFSGTAANEYFYGLTLVGRWIRGVHEAASGGSLIICWIIAGILLIDEFMLFVYTGISLWVMLIVWFPSIWVAKALTNWIVSNPPAPTRTEIFAQNNGQRRIG